METDEELLGRYVATRQEDPFRTLVERHGSMVLAACKRMTGPDAEDAAQAVFLLLASKARNLRGKRQLGPWLYGACQNVSRHIRRDRLRRKHKEREAAVMNASNLSGIPDACRNEAFKQLDAAIAALPERYRQIVVLCYLERMTQEEAAESLGIPLGTVAARRSRALEKLRQKLERAGVGLSLIVLAMLLDQEAAQAASEFSIDSILPSILRGSKVGASAASAGVPLKAEIILEGVTQMLFWTKMKIAAVVVVAVVLAGASIPKVISACAPLLGSASSRQVAQKLKIVDMWVPRPPAGDKDAEKVELDVTIEEALKSKLVVRLRCVKVVEEKKDIKRCIFEVIMQPTEIGMVAGPIEVTAPGKEVGTVDYLLADGEKGKLAANEILAQAMKNMKPGVEFDIALSGNEVKWMTTGQRITPGSDTYALIENKNGDPLRVAYIAAGQEFKFDSSSPSTFMPRAIANEFAGQEGYGFISEEVKPELKKLDDQCQHQLELLDVSYKKYEHNKNNPVALKEAAMAFKNYDIAYYKLKSSVTQAIKDALGASAVVPVRVHFDEFENQISIEGANQRLERFLLPTVVNADPEFLETVISIKIEKKTYAEYAQVLAEAVGAQAVNANGRWKIVAKPAAAPPPQF